MCLSLRGSRAGDLQAEREGEGHTLIYKGKWCRCLSYTPSALSSDGVTESKLVLLPSWKAKKLRDKLLGQRIATLFRKPADWDDGGQVSQRTILLGFWMLVSFIEQRRAGWEGKVKKVISCCKYFLAPARLGRGGVNFFLPTAIHRWAWSGCFLWTEQRYFSLIFRHERQGSQRWAFMYT